MTTQDKLVALDPDLIEPTLDLGRPELHEVLERYLAKEDQPAGPVALIVEGDGKGESEVARALIQAGWEIARCVGPVGTRCPLMSGEECALRCSADVAVVYADPREISEGTSLTPRLRCAGDAGSPGVLVLMGRLDPPRIRGRNAVVGAMRETGVIVGTIEGVRERR